MKKKEQKKKKKREERNEERKTLHLKIIVDNCSINYLVRG
jgi:hypothetical protein